MSWYSYDGYPPYVPVAQRKAQAAREVEKRLKKGQSVSPVKITGRKITTTFWGDAWCKNLEGYSDFENRLPRGRSYVRNGSVVDLKIESGHIKALVSGSELYDVKIDITPLPKANWQALKADCVGKVGTLIELLQGKLSKAVMERVTDRTSGLFPKPKEIAMRCSCPDYAGMCKHVAAAMYGVGHRLDSSPELLFKLRGVDHQELIEQAIPTAPVGKAGAGTIAAGDLGDIFGIDLGNDADVKPQVMPAPKPVKKARAKAGTKAAAAEKGRREKYLAAASKPKKPSKARKPPKKG
jgi:uncharacterized Zn finger protein